MKFFVYVLYSKIFEKSYVGISSNVAERLVEHNAKKSKFTAKYVPWEVVHLEEYEDRGTARKREKYLKSAAGRRWMKLHIDWPSSSTCLDLREARRAG